MKMQQLLERNAVFMGSAATYDEASIALVGVPMDFTVSFRPGTRMGPQQVRMVSSGLEEYSYYLKRSLQEISFYDCGDVVLPYGNVIGSLHRVGAVAEQILKDGKFPLFMGGEHLVSLPIIQAVASRYPDLVLVHLDAHADLREDYIGESRSHATVIRQACKFLRPGHVYQLGIRSGTAEEFRFAMENTRMFPDQVAEIIPQVIAEIGSKPVYITFDIDVVDPAYAPGTGTPEPGGITAREALAVIHQLGQTRVVGFDLVEVSPVYDPSERTTLLAAKLVREAMLTFC